MRGGGLRLGLLLLSLAHLGLKALRLFEEKLTVPNGTLEPFGPHGLLPAQALSLGVELGDRCPPGFLCVAYRACHLLLFTLEVAVLPRGARWGECGGALRAAVVTAAVEMEEAVAVVEMVALTVEAVGEGVMPRQMV